MLLPEHSLDVAGLWLDQSEQESGLDPHGTLHGMKCPLKDSITQKLSIVFPELLSEPSDLKNSYKNKEGNHIHNHNLPNHHGRAHYQTFLCSSP